MSATTTDHQPLTQARLIEMTKPWNLPPSTNWFLDDLEPADFKALLEPCDVFLHDGETVTPRSAEARKTRWFVDDDQYCDAMNQGITNVAFRSRFPNVRIFITSVVARTSVFINNYK